VFHQRDGEKTERKRERERERERERRGDRDRQIERGDRGEESVRVRAACTRCKRKKVCAIEFERVIFGAIDFLLVKCSSPYVTEAKEGKRQMQRGREREREREGKIMKENESCCCAVTGSASYIHSYLLHV